MLSCRNIIAYQTIYNQKFKWFDNRVGDIIFGCGFHFSQELDYVATRPYWTQTMDKKDKAESFQKNKSVLPRFKKRTLVTH